MIAFAGAVWLTDKLVRGPLKRLVSWFLLLALTLVNFPSWWRLGNMSITFIAYSIIISSQWLMSRTKVVSWIRHLKTIGWLVVAGHSLSIAFSPWWRYGNVVLVVILYHVCLFFVCLWHVGLLDDNIRVKWVPLVRYAKTASWVFLLDLAYRVVFSWWKYGNVGFALFFYHVCFISLFLCHMYMDASRRVAAELGISRMY